MNILVNGEKYIVDTGISLLTFLRSQNIDEATIIVEYNNSLVTRDKFSETILADNAELELIRFVGGG